MIFWRQSLFRFSRHLLADMLIFLTRCAIFFVFSTNLSATRRGRRQERPPLLMTERKLIETKLSEASKAPANRGGTEHTATAPPTLRFERRGRIYVAARQPAAPLSERCTMY